MQSKEHWRLSMHFLRGVLNYFETKLGLGKVARNYIQLEATFHMRFCHIRNMTVTKNTYCETRSLLTVECKQYFTVDKAFSHEPRQFDFSFPAALMRNIEAIHL